MFVRLLQTLLLFCSVVLASCVTVTSDVLINDAAADNRFALDPVPLDQLQFFGSHNSYKKRMDPLAQAQLQQINPAAAHALEYWHEPLATQLNMGLRVFEFDVFFDPQQRLFKRGGTFPVLHVQNLDTNSHCATLRDCVAQLALWLEENPASEPLFISFNAKTDVIDQPGFVQPLSFDAAAWRALDATLAESFAARLLRPAQVLGPAGPAWPTLAEARGKVLLLLDEGAQKTANYLTAVDRPTMFVNVPADDPRAAIRVLNDPLAQASEIRAALQRGLLVRTRADADTAEARSGDTTRRDAAFASGAQFVSTDYYLPATHFDSEYVASLPGGEPVRCNPVRESGCLARAVDGLAP